MHCSNSINGYLVGLVMVLVCLSCQDGTDRLPDSTNIPDIIVEDGGEREENEDSLISENCNPCESNFIFEENFEGEDPFYAYVHKQFPGSHSFKKISTKALLGNSSGRFELRIHDQKVTSSGTRSEVLFQKPDQKDMWYSFGIYLPSNGFSKDPHNDILSQWHEGGSPKISLRVQNDVFRLRLLNENLDIESLSLATASKDTWHGFVFHIIHSGGRDGLIEVWHNGKKVAEKQGPNNFAAFFPAWKIGIYKPGWNGGTSTSDLRVAYFDNIRMGNKNTNLEEMQPTQENSRGWGPIVPDPKNLIAINANNNQAVKTIINGGKINHRTVSTDRITIEAEMPEEFTGSVQFRLRGAKDFDYLDNVKPFVVFGDDGKGKYYNGGGLPKGKYTLTVTSFAERGAKGKMGNPISIAFEVVDEK